MYRWESLTLQDVKVVLNDKELKIKQRVKDENEAISGEDWLKKKEQKEKKRGKNQGKSRWNSTVTKNRTSENNALRGKPKQRRIESVLEIQLLPLMIVIRLQICWLPQTIELMLCSWLAIFLLFMPKSNLFSSYIQLVERNGN